MPSVAQTVVRIPRSDKRRQTHANDERPVLQNHTAVDAEQASADMNLSLLVVPLCADQPHATMSNRASRAKATQKQAEANKDAMKQDDTDADAVASPSPAASTSPAPPLISLGAGAAYSSPLVAHVLRLPPGADLFPCLNAFLRQQNVQAACILSVVGSLTHVCMRFANVPDRDVVPLPPAHYEVLSLSGCLSSTSGSHIHMSVADRTGRCIGGHLQPLGNLVYTTLEIVVGIMPQLRFARETDQTFGYQELAVYPAANPVSPAAATNGAAEAATNSAAASASCCQTSPSAANGEIDAALPDAAATPVAPVSSPSQKRSQSEKRKHQAEPTVAPASAADAASSSAAVPAVSAVHAAHPAKKTRANASPASKRATRTSSSVKDEGKTVGAGAISVAVAPAASPSPSPSPAVSSSLSPPAASSASAVSAVRAPPSAWNGAQFALFLTKLSLTHLVPLFELHKIGAARFLELTSEDVQRIGLKT